MEWLNRARKRLRRIGPRDDEIDAAKQELLRRAAQLGVPIDGAADYPTVFASLRRSQATPFIDAINTADPNYSQLVASVTKAQLAGLRSRFSSIQLAPASRNEALDFIWEAHSNDAVCALEQVQVLATVRKVLSASIAAFVGLLAIQALFAAILGSLPLFDTAAVEGSRMVKVGMLMATNANNFLLSPYILAAIIAVLGALFGINLDLPLEGSSPHWRLVRQYSRVTRCWAGAAAGLLTAAMAPLLGTAGQGQEGGARLFVAAFVFGFSQELFLKKLQNIAGVDSKS